jgi:thioester reductase-like protein
MLTVFFVVLDNQWPVNFNLALPSFEPHIAGSLNLIRLSSESYNNVPIFFTSSIGALRNWPLVHPGVPVPEVALDDPLIPTQQGYSESKWITERLLDAARERCGVSGAILRVGQIAGPVNVKHGKHGAWNKQEWLPTVIIPLFPFAEHLQFTYILTDGLDY